MRIHVNTFINKDIFSFRKNSKFKELQQEQEFQKSSVEDRKGLKVVKAVSESFFIIHVMQ